MPYLLGIDVGTTHTKAVVYAPETGEIVASGHCRTVTHHPRPGWSDFQPDEVWAGVVQSVREALAQCSDRADIAAVAVASMGEAGIPLDQHGAPLYPIIAWHDPRTEAQSRWWLESFGAERIFAITGQLV